MNDYYYDAAFSMEIDLRYKLYWLDNSHDDSIPDLSVNAGTMYFDMTLMGMEINYSSNGVPNYMPHRLSDRLDMSCISPFDFEKTGEMPMV